MVTYIVRRLFAAVVLLLVVTLVTFVIFFVLPTWAGQSSEAIARSYLGRGQVSQASLNAVMQRLGLNQPLWLHYLNYVKALFVGTNVSDGTLNANGTPELIRCNAPCFGYSFRNSQPVWPQLTSAFPVTFSIALGAGVLWLVFGVLSGVVSAVRKGTVLDRLSMLISLAGVSLPVYFILPLATLFFVYNWDLLPNAGYVPFLQNPGSWAANLFLPCACLAFGYAALYTRLTRAGMLDAMNEDFVRTARAKGLPERKVILKHGLRAAITPIVTIFGMDLGAVLGGAVLVEAAASMHGLGYLAINAINSQDFPVMMGVTLFGAFFIVIANLVVDVLYATLDPRVKL
jgi:peptide/nickel transport system permease protein